MKNDDDQCFKWAVTRALNPVNKDSDRITKELKNQAKKLNWDGITFPVKVNDIHIWEKITINSLTSSATTKTLRRYTSSKCLTDALAQP